MSGGTPAPVATAGEAAAALGEAIPIRNLYRMLLYAWDVLPEAAPRAADEEDPSTLADLLGRMLCDHMQPVLARGLEQDYLEQEASLTSLRGRILVGPTVLGQHDRRGRAVCRFDERSPDIAINRAIKATARLLLRSDLRSTDTRDRLHRLVERLAAITDVRPTPELLGPVRLHRNNRRYRIPVSICRLVLARIAPDERTGRLSLAGFLRDEHAMRRLFERFVRRFLAFEIGREPGRPDGPRVRAEHLAWAPGIQPLVPRLETDVTLRWPDHVRIVECKFTRRVTRPRAGGGRVLHAGYLRQVHAYCAAMAATGVESVDAVLLHARPAAERLDVRVRLLPFDCRVLTLDLAAEWTELDGQLRSVAARDAGAAAPSTGRAGDAIRVGP